MAKMLVLDDSEDMREILSTILGYFGHAVTLAEDGLQAVEALKVGSFDLIITDLDVPQISGEAFIQLVRGMERYQRTPIVVVSASAERVAGVSGIQGVLIKPVTPTNLRQAVDAALAGP